MSRSGRCVCECYMAENITISMPTSFNFMKKVGRIQDMENVNRSEAIRRAVDSYVDGLSAEAQIDDYIDDGDGPDLPEPFRQFASPLPTKRLDERARELVRSDPALAARVLSNMTIATSSIRVARRDRPGVQ